MAFFMLITSTGFSIDLHFCRGEIENIGLYDAAAPCEMKQQLQTKTSETKKMSCCEKEALEKAKAKHTTVSEKTCCHNHRITVEGNFEVDQQEDRGIHIDDLSFAAVFLGIQLHVLPVQVTSDPTNLHAPPLIEYKTTLSFLQTLLV